MGQTANPITRRRLLAGAAPLTAAAVLAPGALAAGLKAGSRKRPTLGGGHFAEGVMSGEPTPHAVTVWTRLDGAEGAGSVLLEVATDSDFRHTVERRLISTGAAAGHAVKARVTGLKAHEQYFYRFATKTRDSPVGRTRTALPPDSKAPVTFAFWSCQDYTHGFYNAHALLAKGDYDFVVCLGDYIYDETYHSRADGTGVRDDTIGSLPPGYGAAEKSGVHSVALTLQDYRDKYKLYRSDERLRAVQQAFPSVILWDDHEVQDNYAGAAANGGLGPDLHYTAARRRAAYRAFFESQPLSPRGRSRIYRTLSFGNTLDMIVMDQRQYRADQPCGDATVTDPCPGFDGPRDFLGRTQMSWVKGQLSGSKAAWKVLANEVMIMPTKVLGGKLFNLDSWQGYPQERTELLTHIRDKQVKDVVFLTGDIHTFITGDVRIGTDQTRSTAADSIAVEFVGGSVTSTGLGETSFDAGGITLKGNDANPQTSPAIIQQLTAINPWIDQADFDHHGFAEVSASQDAFTCRLRRVATIKQRSTAQLAPISYTLKRGQTSIKGAAS